MDARTQAFLEVSADLTGFCRVELAGTGMLGEYLATLDAGLPPGLLDRLLRQWREATPDRVLDDPTLGPVARAVVLKGDFNVHLPSCLTTSTPYTLSTSLTTKMSRWK